MSTIVSTSDLRITKGNIVHRLAARAIIRDWEDGNLRYVIHINPIPPHPIAVRMSCSTR